MAFKGITAFVLGNNGEGGGGGGGTTNYNDLTNHPQINGNELTGNKTADQLGLLPADTDIPTKLSDLDEDVTHRTVTDLEKQSWNNKVDSVAGKGLSTNDYTDEDKTALANKVDKVTGKGLSTNDYTDGEKEDVAQIDGLVGTVGSLSSAVGIVSSKVGTLEGEMLSVQDALDTKVNKETGKGLSTNDYTNADKAIVDGVTTALAGKVDTSSIGTANGVAGLDNTGRVPSSQLPSYVDDVLEYASLSAFPATGEGGKIYIALDTNKTYRWSGSAYVEISESLALGETQGTAYEGNKGKANADAIDALETTVEAIPDQIETVVKDTVGFVGKNLFDGKATTVTDQYGVTWTVDPDDNNVVTVSGTPTGFKSFHISSINVLPAGSYKLSGLENTVNVSFNLVRLVKNGTTVRSIPDNMFDPFVIEQSDDYDTIVVELKRGVNGVTCSGTAYVMIRKAEVTDSTYEPYHETVQEMFDSLGTASTKNAISVVTDSGDLVESGAVKDIVGWGNKNLFSGFSSNYSNYHVIATVNTDKTVTVTNDGSSASANAFIEQDVNYTFPYSVILSGCPTNGSDASYRLDANGNYSDHGEGVTIPANTNITKIRIRIANGYTPTNLVFKPMIRLATITDDTYEPYHASVEEMFESLGGTLACNQLVQNGNFADTSNWSGVRGSISVSDNELTYTISEKGNSDITNRIVQNLSNAPLANHVVIAIANIYLSKVCNVALELLNSSSIGDVISFSGSVGWNNISAISKKTDETAIMWIGFNATNYSVGDTVKFKNVMLIDLTQLFGSAIADYIYSLEQATAGAGVAYFRKYFPNDYYDYQTNNGILNVLDSAKADNSVIGTVEGENASKAWSVGEHFIKDGAFCTCTQPIAQGGTFTLNTNYTVRDVASCLIKKKTVTAVSSASGSIEVDSNIIMVACAYCTTDSNIICLPFIYDNHTYVHLRNRNVNGWDAITSGSVTVDIYYFD